MKNLLVVLVLLVALFFHEAQCGRQQQCASTTTIQSMRSSLHLTDVRRITQCEDFSSCMERFLMSLRGGADEEEEEVESTPLVVVALQKTLSMAAKVTISTCKTMVRAISAAFQSEDEEEAEEELSAMDKVFRVLKRMWKAAMEPSSSSETKEGSVPKKMTPVAKATTADDDDDDETAGKEVTDNNKFAVFLAKSYGVSLGDMSSAPDVAGRSIGEALEDARSKARLLVVLIPASRPSKKKASESDRAAIESLLSSEVASIVERRARKKGSDGGSYVVWAAKAGSSEAVQAMKWIKAKQPSGGQRKPTLAVVYPAQARSSTTGKIKVMPKLLAQHHCSPPPSAEAMAAWLNVLRKRHVKQYAAMQLQQKELELKKEREQGYQSSVQDDKKRKVMEQQAREEQKVKEAEEKKRLAAIEARRKEFLESLPEEPAKDSTVMTIALRFQDGGRTGQRRFSPDTPMQTVFNWIDATYRIERETLILTTMNGQKKFSWDDVADGGDNEDSLLLLRDTGLGRMSGLRVSVKQDATTTDPKGEEESKAAASATS